MKVANAPPSVVEKQLEPKENGVLPGIGAGSGSLDI
jgi:hypothetical protein